MTPPRINLFPYERPLLTCPECETGASLIVEGPEKLFIARADQFIPALSEPEPRILRPINPPRLLSIHWRSSPRLLSPERLEPDALWAQPARPLAEAYIDTEFLSFWEFLPAIRTLGNRIESLDLDFFNVPVNRGGGHCRFSEYAPLTERRHECGIEVQRGTVARAHGEIRPIRGRDESWITRVTVDFRPNVLSTRRAPITIDGFAAVDPPHMEFDPRFPGRDASCILEMSGGNFDYENPLGRSADLTTPFASVRRPPPGQHPFWMFRFMPVYHGDISDIFPAFGEAFFSEPFLLWAFLPTWGITDRASFSEVGVPHNTFPRRLGDLIYLLRPLFSSWRRDLVRREAPFFNPNTEYLDLNGQRQPIPGDPVELARVNAERAAYNRGRPPSERLPRIALNRGPVLDWVFSDLLQDPSRLTPLLHDLEHRPHITSRIRFRETDLDLPIGRLTLGEGTEAELSISVEPFRDPVGGDVEGRLNARLTLNNLELRNVDLEIQNYHIRARRLHVDQAAFHVRDLGALFSGEAPPDGPLQIDLTGVRVEGLELTDRRNGLGGTLGNGESEGLHFTYHDRSWRMSINDGGMNLRQLAIQTLLGRVAFAQATVPELRLRSSRREGTDGQWITLEAPSVSSRSELAFTYRPPREGTPLGLRMRGQSTLSNLQYFFHPAGEIRHQIRFDVRGQVREARIEHEAIGAIFLSTLRERGAARSEPMRGSVHLRFPNPDATPEGQAPPPRVLPVIHLDLPFVALGSESGHLNIPRESSTIERGSLDFLPNAFSLEGHLNISGAEFRWATGNGRFEFGDFLVAAEQMEGRGIRAEGPVRFEMRFGNPAQNGWRLGRIPGSSEPLNLGARIENLGFVYLNPSSYLPPGIPPTQGVPEVFQTRVDLRHADVEIPDLRVIQFQSMEGSPGRLTRLESGPVSIHHLQGGGSIWAPLPIWGMVRGFFPTLGSDPNERPPRRPDPGPLVAHLPEEVRCSLGDGDFIRVGGIRYRFWPLSPQSRQERNERNSQPLEPRGDWEARLDDLIINIHEASVPGGPPSRGQFGLIRIPQLNFGRVWRPENRGPFQTCTGAPAGEPATCGAENPYFDMGLGEILAYIYLNDPQRGGSFLFPRWSVDAGRQGLSTYLASCPSR